MPTEAAASMAVFKGGPALPKRTERADEGDDAMSGKRQRRTTELLSNPIHEGQPDDDNSTTQRNNSRKDANKMPMVIEGGDTAKPVSELRSTMDAEMDDAREGSTTPVKEEFDLPPPPTTPKKRSKVKAERNDLLKTPTKKEEAGSSSAAQRSPREQAPLASVSIILHGESQGRN